MAVRKSTRFKVFLRDEFQCQYCGRRPPDVVLECDHIHPKSKGGADDETNLTTACWECNIGKSDKVLDSTQSNVLESQFYAAEKLAQLAAFNEMLAAVEADIEDAAHDVWSMMLTRMGIDSAPRQILAGVRRSIREGVMTHADYAAALDICISQGRNPGNEPGYTSDTRAWRYFLGVVKKIREGNQVAL